MFIVREMIQNKERWSSPRYLILPEPAAVSIGAFMSVRTASWTSAFTSSFAPGTPVTSPSKFEKSVKHWINET